MGSFFSKFRDENHHNHNNSSIDGDFLVVKGGGAGLGTPDIMPRQRLESSSPYKQNSRLLLQQQLSTSTSKSSDCCPRARSWQKNKFLSHTSTSTTRTSTCTMTRTAAADETTTESDVGCSLSSKPISSSKLDENGHLRPFEVYNRRSTESGMTAYTRNGGGGVDLNENEDGTNRERRVVYNIQYAICSQRCFHPEDIHQLNQETYSVTPEFGKKIKAGDSSTSTLFTLHDGHGPHGQIFSSYAKEQIPRQLSKHIQQERARLYKEQQQNKKKARGMNDKAIIPKQDSYRSRHLFDPTILFPDLNEEEYETALTKAHLECNQQMINGFLKDKVDLSGTSSICAMIYNGKLIISNVGDSSRAVLGSFKNSKEPSDKNPNSSMSLDATPLSNNQTPLRKDERDRVIKAGGKVMTDDELNKYRNSYHDMEETTYSFGHNLVGEEDDFLDIKGNLPRIWLSETDQAIPGTTFTRSLGDAIAETIGVCAKPEFYSRDITDDDKVLVLGSDGVFEFLSNQSVIDICAKCSCPLAACELIVDRSYNEWLNREHQSDDITVIVIFLSDSLFEPDKKNEKEGETGGTNTNTLTEDFCFRPC